MGRTCAISWNVFHDHPKNSLVGSRNTGDGDTVPA
jgi:pectate lyase